MYKPEEYPIIFIHKSNSHYLPYSLYQIRASNPKNPIYFIGDKSNSGFSDLVQHHLITDYSHLADAFAPNYKHYSENGFDYEIFCILRWFILLEFMQKHKIERCLYIDSDILYFADAATEQVLTEPYGLTIITKSPHTNYINSIGALEKICEFITTCYTTEDGLKLILEMYEEHLSIHGKVGGIEDMNFFLQYKKFYPDRVLDLNQIIEKRTYDITIDTPNNYETEANGLKKVTFINNQPYIKYLPTGESIRYVTLHFQGRSKEHIAKYLPNPPATFGLWLGYLSFVRNVQKVIAKVIK